MLWCSAFSMWFFLWGKVSEWKLLHVVTLCDAILGDRQASLELSHLVTRPLHYANQASFDFPFFCAVPSFKVMRKRRRVTQICFLGLPCRIATVLFLEIITVFSIPGHSILFPFSFWTKKVHRTKWLQISVCMKFVVQLYSNYFKCKLHFLVWR